MFHLFRICFYAIAFNVKRGQFVHGLGIAQLCGLLKPRRAQSVVHLYAIARHERGAQHNHGVGMVGVGRF